MGWGQVSGGSFIADGKLTFTAVSSNPTLLPNTTDNIDIEDLTSGGGGERSVDLILAEHQHGESIVTFTISDGVDWTQKQLRLKVNSVNDTPSFVVNPSLPAITIEGVSDGQAV